MIRALVPTAIVAALAVVGVPAGVANQQALAVCSSPCEDPLDAKVEASSIADPAYDAAVDEDVFNVHTIAADLCAAAREQVDAGISEDDMIDAAVVVFTVDAPLVTTEAGVWYLRGVLRGCVA